MAQLIVRDLDERVVAALKARAARNGRSTEAEHRRLLEAVAAGEAPDMLQPDMPESDMPESDMAAFAEAAARLRARFRSTADSAQVIREARDARHG